MRFLRLIPVMGAVFGCAHPSAPLPLVPFASTCPMVADGTGGSGSPTLANIIGPGRTHVLTNSQRVLDAVKQLGSDPFLGEFIKEMADDPHVTYFVWDSDHADSRRDGGGITTNCDAGRFDIWVNVEYHLSLEGRKCANPVGSGNLRSLIAHELGHAWGWNLYGDYNLCDNAAPGTRIAVAWENTQLAGRAERLVHNRDGCPCTPHSTLGAEAP